MEIGDVVKNYKVTKVVSQKFSRSVFQVEDDSGRTYMLVSITRFYPLDVDSADVKMEENLLLKLKNLSNSYLVKIKDTFVLNNHSRFFVSDYYKKDLRETLKDSEGILPNSRILKIFNQLTTAIHFLHSHGITHREIRLEHIFVDDDGDIKLGGLGDSWMSEQSLRIHKTLCGVPDCIAPEVLLEERHTNICDLFSLGAVMYETIEMQDLPRDDYFGAKLPLPFKGDDKILSPIRELIGKLVSVPSLRPTIREVAQVLIKWSAPGVVCPVLQLLVSSGSIDGNIGVSLANGGNMPLDSDFEEEGEMEEV